MGRTYAGIYGDNHFLSYYQIDLLKRRVVYAYAGSLSRFSAKRYAAGFVDPFEYAGERFPCSDVSQSLSCCKEVNAKSYIIGFFREILRV